MLRPVQRSVGPIQLSAVAQTKDEPPPSADSKQHTWFDGSHDELPHVMPGVVPPELLDELPPPDELPLDELALEESPPDELLPTDPDELPLLDELTPDEDAPLLEEEAPDEPLALEVPDWVPLLEDALPARALSLPPSPVLMALPDELLPGPASGACAPMAPAVLSKPPSTPTTVKPLSAPPNAMASPTTDPTIRNLPRGDIGLTSAKG